MKIAAAQIEVKDGDVNYNLSLHKKLAGMAIENNTDLLIFPEMSMTGYLMQNARDYAFENNDTRLDELQSVVNEHGITLVTGAPYKSGEDLYIAAFILQPDKEILVYTKRYLHPGEEKYFKPGVEFNSKFLVGDLNVSVAICADITNPEHPRSAADAGADLYLASIFYTPKGIDEAYEQLSEYAKMYGMKILMSNYTGSTFGFKAAGRSAFWNDKGELKASFDSQENGILYIDIN